MPTQRRRRFAVLLVAALIVGAGGGWLRAHQETLKGTVLAVGEASVRVNVVNPDTKRETPRTFIVDEETKVLRGDTLIGFAGARIERGENIAVTVNHDVNLNLALVIRLDPAN